MACRLSIGPRYPGAKKLKFDFLISPPTKQIGGWKIFTNKSWLANLRADKKTA
jgi:hypothetical protein